MTACLLCGAQFGSNCHIGRHVLNQHGMKFADYDWQIVKKNVDPPVCSNPRCAKSLRPHSGRYPIYCSRTCRAQCHALSEAGRSKVSAIAKQAHTRHGHSARGAMTRTYRSWENMLTRCKNPRATHYRNYGGRGIRVCDRWVSFENFLADMGEAPPGMTLDRYPNNNGGYEPNNCRWATRKQQRANRRDSQPTPEGEA